MTVPTGFVEATRVTGVVKIPDRQLPDGGFIPGSIVGPGDTAVIPEGEAHESDFWTVAVSEAPASKTPSKKKEGD